ncbi:MAG: hypothetical protein AUI11_07540 [Acidobacteria bacterium 13_2_20CM_2_66_4]|nr:MAG: hypothetical protein AUI11_07540 [Acidobacteria bacterium 13_2_20CM_2_66_4]
MNRARLIEEGDGEARHLMRVVRPEVASLGKLEDAPAAHVRIAIRLRDLLPMLRDVIEHESFTQRQVAQRELLCAKPTEDFVDEHHAGDDEIGAPRFEAGHPQPLLERHRGEFLAEAAHLLRGDAAIAERRGLASPFRSRDDGANAENGAGCADDPVEAGARDLIEVFPDFRVDVAHELAFVARLDGIALDEAFGQSDDAELEAPSEVDGGAAAARDLDAAAADVDDDGDITRDADAVHGGGMDEPCFLRAGDHARANAGFSMNCLQEFAAVLCFAHRARRDGYHIFNAVRFGQTPEFGQHLERGMHCLRRERATVETAGAEAHHFLFAIDDLEGKVRPYLHHYHVDRVGADVDGRYPHVSTIITVSACV